MRPVASLPAVLLCLALAPTSPSSAGESARVPVEGRRALETVKTLAADSFLGRKSGLLSGRASEEWMAKAIARVGLEPLDGTYDHSFEANVTTEGKQPEFVIRGGGEPDRRSAYLEDYVTLVYAGEGAVIAPVVFVGYGIHAPDKEWDDYAGVDVAGKVVMAVRGKPAGSRFDEERYIGYKSSTAADRGAAGFLLVEGDRAVPGTIQERYHRADLPAVWLSRRAADDLLGRGGLGTLEDAKRRARAGPGAVALEGASVKLSIQGKLLRDRMLRNVVGLWRGTGETDEYVVLGAHLDHLGTDAAGNIYNGADDNASGSAMLLEVARAMARTGTRFRRHVLFVWFAGEEQGLLGSWAFVKRPPVPLESIAVMINADMVGQGRPVIARGGGEVYPRDEAWLPEVGDVKTRRFRSAPNSDHYPFQTRGVPAFFVHTAGPHPNYHQPGDDWTNIDPALLGLAGRYVRALAEHVARSERPHCRPRRLAEYLWHDAKVLALRGGRDVPGVDLFVQWFGEDFGALGRAMEATSAQDGDAFAVQGYGLGAALRALEPGSFFGVRGRAALHHRRVARAAGVSFFAPWLGLDPAGPSVDWPRTRGSVLCLQGAPDDLDVSRLEGPLLLGAAGAERFGEALRGRPEPWLVALELRPLVENKPPAWDEVAAELLRARERFGADRVVLCAHDDGDDSLARQAPTLMPGLVDALLRRGMKRADLYPFLGGHAVRFLEQALEE